MSRPFLKSVADFIFENYEDKVEQLCLILPNKRGALFLKNYLAQSFNKTIWLPTIISAEDLIAELSQLKVLDEIDLICHLYESYRICYGKEAESFDGFAKWGQLILQDFNEIDRYLADPKELYENLKDIKVIENWSLGEETLSEHQVNYLKFMNSLSAIYNHFSGFLLKNKWAYQGLAYREAVRNLNQNSLEEKFHKLIFCGFNALNASEIKIVEHFHKKQKIDLLWDADNYYLKDTKQEAGFFLRNNFKLFPQKEVFFVEDHFLKEKIIKIVSVPKQLGQGQVIKQHLEILLKSGITSDKIAIVLANEKLLWPVLRQIPSSVEHLNITMEYPLKYTSAYDFVEKLIHLQLTFSKQTGKQKTIYHKDLLAFLRQPLLINFFNKKKIAIDVNALIYTISEKNLSFVSQKKLEELFAENFEAVKQLLLPCKSVNKLNENLRSFLSEVIDFNSNNNVSDAERLEMEYLRLLLKNFNRLSEVLATYRYFNELSAYKQLFTLIVGNATAPFIGEPLKGLQIMGVLETRTLDFEHLILVNVNEGVLPSGKTIHSFIPNDLKRAFALPLYIEKDAIYAYHFYRLLQRAKNVLITYDSETDSFGKGEKSRFLTQLQLELSNYNSNIKITEEVAAYDNLTEETANQIHVAKTASVMSPILKKAESNKEFGGLSPSALITYKDCSLKFYFRYSARLKESVEVEESAEAGTFGSILHRSLENLYKDLLTQPLSPLLLKNKYHQIGKQVSEAFSEFFDTDNLVGKNYLQKEVIEVYVKKLLHYDITLSEKLTQKNQNLTIVHLEKEFNSSLNIEFPAGNSTLYIKGKIDRIDAFSDSVRVIDYKSSIKETDKFTFEGFEKLFYDKRYNKQLQLLLYAWLLYKNNFCEARRMKPCIISFKNFDKETKYIIGQDKEPMILSDEFLTDFEVELKKFITSLFNHETKFLQTEDKKTCEYCAYNAICNVSL